MPDMTMTSSIGISVGVTAAVSAALFAATLVSTILILRKRHERALVEVERGLITGASMTNLTNAGVPPPKTPKDDLMPSALSHGRLSNHTIGNVNEDSRAGRKWPFRYEKRKSSSHSSWALSRKRQGHEATPVLALEELSPCATTSNKNDLVQVTSIQALTQNVPVCTEVPTPIAIPSADKTPLTSTTPKASFTPVTLSKTWTAASLTPLPLFSARTSAAVGMPRCKPNRSVSVPLILSSLPNDALSGTTQSIRKSGKHLRSSSLGSQNLHPAPDGILQQFSLCTFSEPYVHRRIQGGSLLRKPTTAVQSPETYGLYDSNSTANSIDGNRRGQDLQETRRQHLGSLMSVRNYSIAGPRPMKSHSQTVQTLDTRPHDTIPPARIRRNMSETRARTPNNANGHAQKTSNRLSVGELQTADSVRMSKVSTGSSQIDFISTIHVLSTPNHYNSNVRKVSEHGSPSARKRPLVLRDISGNGCLSPRDLSQKSVFPLSIDDDKNPFNWKSPVDHKRLLNKSSPATKKSRKKCNVRIYSVPTVLGPPCESVSSSGMDEISEEELELDGQHCRLRPRDRYSQSDLIQHPPSLSTFAPELSGKITSLRASLTPSSPTLSCAPYCRDDELSAACEFGGDGLNMAADAKSKLGRSTILFDSPADSSDKNSRVHVSKIKFEGWDSASIPGLTLLCPQNQSNQELCYPKIEVSVSSIEGTSKSTQCCKTRARQTSPDAPRKESHGASAFLTGFALQSKPSTTTQVTKPEDCYISTIRTTPLSSTVHPLNTKPYLPPPHNRSSTLLSHPQGPRPRPGQDVMRSVRGLRRENSEAMSLQCDSRGTRRYLTLGREVSPHSNSSNAFFPEEVEEEIENKYYNSNWSDGVDFWSSGHNDWRTIA